MDSARFFSESNPVKVFISYSHIDERLKDRLFVFLSQLIRDEVIEPWTDRDILAGAVWGKEKQQKLESADLILLLISPDFIACPNCYDVEMMKAMERRQKGTAVVIPLLLRPADWETSPFALLQGLPKNSQPVTQWDNEDLAFIEIVREIRSVCKSRFI
jgi:TIR domain